MKKLLLITAVSIALPLKTFANTQKLEQAIMESHPQKLEQLLSKIILNKHQKNDYLKLATEIYQMRKSKTFWRENPSQGENLAVLGGMAFIGGITMGLPYIFDYVDPFVSPYGNNTAKPFNYRYASINGSLFLVSSLFFYLAYKENQKPGWRSRKDEYLDAFKICIILNNLADENNEINGK